MTTHLEPDAIPRAAGRTWQDLLDLDSHPVPPYLRDQAPYVSTMDDVPVDRYLSRDYHELGDETYHGRLTDVSVLGVSQTVLEIMALGRVVVGSPTGAILPAVHDGVDGVIASGADATRARVRTLFAEPETRARIGAAARAATEHEWDVRTRVDQLLSLLALG